jgi:hypothetical protein
MHAVGLASAVMVAGCYDALTPEPKNMVRWDAKNVQAYAETARGDADIAYGSGFELRGEVARWRECTSPTDCTRVERQRPAGDVLAIEHIGPGQLADGTEVDVVKLSLTPGRKYVVPAVNYVPAR